MTHKPIHLAQFSFILPHKTCFHEPDVVLRYGQRIALIGDNGSGKSTLLRMVHDVHALDLRAGYVPQIHDDEGLSGAQLFQRSLTLALKNEPNLLLLDEPTNHLDVAQRYSLKRMLKAFPHTYVVATHDDDLLRQCFDGFWHLNDGVLRAFYGDYDDYCAEIAQERSAIVAELATIRKGQRRAHALLMREQARAKKSRKKGEKSIAQNKWPTIVSNAKATRAEQTTGKKKAVLAEKRTHLEERLENLRLPEVVTPKFHFASINNTGVVLMVQNAWCGYDAPVVRDINLTLRFGERLFLTGKNASGKSTVLKAIMNHNGVARGGTWQTPAHDDIGYLDQNYRNLAHDKTPLQSLAERRPDWTITELRDHLNSFLFRKNEEVMTPIAQLSGGERARLSLCLIAAKSPRLLLLDEITNNVDRKTREHLIQTLLAYEGSMVLISHDEEFLRGLSANVVGIISDGRYLPDQRATMPCT